MHPKKILGLFGAVAVVAAISVIVAFENTDAKGPSLNRMHVMVGMDHFFEIRAGQIMTIPVNLTNTNIERESSVNLYVTSHGYEHFKDSPVPVFEDNGIGVRLSKSSSTIPASTGDVLQMDSMSVTVSVPKDTEPGLYEYTLIAQAANESIQVRKHFYITVA